MVLERSKTGARPPGRALRTAFSALLIAWFGAPAAQAGDYRLGAADRVRVKVVEFSRDSLTPTEWSVMTGDYAVSDTGQVVLPILGPVPATGLTVEALNGAIVARVRDVIGLDETRNGGTSVTASVEVVEYRPFFVLGAVENPGAFPFRPDVTVLQAISLAGGLVRTADENGWSLQREAINAQGALRGIQLETSALAFRQARLQAEFDGADAIAFPAVPEAVFAEPGDRAAALDAIRRDETAIFEGRSIEVRRQVESMDRQKTLLENEVDSLLKQIDAQNLQSALIAKDLKAVSSLADRGLVTASRRLTLERATAEVESKALQFQTAVIQVRQDINRVERERASLLDKRRNDIATELREARAALDAIAGKRETSQALLAKLAATGATPPAASGGQTRLITSIVRRKAGGGFVEEFDVPESTALEPGDTIKVMLEGETQGGMAPAVAATP